MTLFSSSLVVQEHRPLRRLMRLLSSAFVHDYCPPPPPPPLHHCCRRRCCQRQILGQVWSQFFSQSTCHSGFFSLQKVFFLTFPVFCPTLFCHGDFLTCPANLVCGEPVMVCPTLQARTMKTTREVEEQRVVLIFFVLWFYGNNNGVWCTHYCGKVPFKQWMRTLLNVICTYGILKEEVKCFKDVCALFELTIYCFKWQRYGFYIWVYSSV